MGMKVTLQLPGRTIEVDAVVRGGLAVHRRTWRDASRMRWTISHVGTGKRIGDLRTKAIAIEVMGKLLALDGVDWEGDVTQNIGARDVVMPIIWEAQLR